MVLNLHGLNLPSEGPILEEPVVRVSADPAGHEGRVVHGQVGEGRGVAEVDRSVLHAVAANVITTIPSEQRVCIDLVSLDRRLAGEGNVVAKVDLSVCYSVAVNNITTIPSEQRVCIVLVRWQV